MSTKQCFLVMGAVLFFPAAASATSTGMLHADLVQHVAPPVAMVTPRSMAGTPTLNRPTPSLAGSGNTAIAGDTLTRASSPVAIAKSTVPAPGITGGMSKTHSGAPGAPVAGRIDSPVGPRVLGSPGRSPTATSDRMLAQGSTLTTGSTSQTDKHSTPAAKATPRPGDASGRFLSTTPPTTAATQPDPQARDARGRFMPKQDRALEARLADRRLRNWIDANGAGPSFNRATPLPKKEPVLSAWQRMNGYKQMMGQ